MKKLLITAVVLFSSSVTFAQGIYWGPKAALNFASISQTSNTSTRLRGAVGLFAGYQVAKTIAIQAEALYSWQGANVALLGGNEQLTLNYIKIPVLAKVFIIGGLNAEAGLSFNFLTSARDTYGSKNEAIKGLNSFDLAVPVGLNYLLFNRVEVGLRYDIAFVNLGTGYSRKAKNSNWQFSVAIRF